MKVTNASSSTLGLVVPQTREQIPPQPSVDTLTSPRDDRLEISDEARAKAKEAGTRHLGRLNEHAAAKMAAFFDDLLRRLTGREVDDLEFLPSEQEAPMPLPGQTGATAGTIQQTTVNVEQQTFSFSGMIKTADGKEVAFALDLQITHSAITSESLAFQSGPEGAGFTYAGTAAELTSTSFSFSLAATDTDPERAKGIGRFNIGDDLAKIRKLLSNSPL